MGNEPPKKNYQPRLEKQRLEIACIKVIAHLELQRDRKISQGNQKEKLLIQMINSPQRNKVDEVHKASSVITDMNFINGCNIIIRFCGIIKDRSLLICDSVGNPNNIQELLPYIESVIWAAKYVNLNCLQEFQNMMLNFFGAQGIDVTSSPKVDKELKKCFEVVLPSPQDINDYMVKLSEKTGLSLDHINQAGHEFVIPGQQQQQQQHPQGPGGFGGPGGQGGFGGPGGAYFPPQQQQQQGAQIGGYFPPQQYNVQVQVPGYQPSQQQQQYPGQQQQFNQPSGFNQPPQQQQQQFQGYPQMSLPQENNNNNNNNNNQFSQHSNPYSQQQFSQNTNNNNQPPIQSPNLSHISANTNNNVNNNQPQQQQQQQFQQPQQGSMQFQQAPQYVNKQQDQDNQNQIDSLEERLNRLRGGV